MICVYSCGPVKTDSFVPLAWNDLENLAGLSDPEKLQVVYSEAIGRVEKNGIFFRLYSRKNRGSLICDGATPMD